MNLFQEGDFISHAGNLLHWKIECDALTDEDWDCLARIIHERVRFGSVYGIPSGGTKLALALEKYITPGHPLRLVVDDVYTSGQSMKEAMTGPNDYGFVIFARSRIPYREGKYIRALFTMDMI